MGGNIYEWNEAPSVWLDAQDEERVLRGGDWYDESVGCSRPDRYDCTPATSSTTSVFVSQASAQLSRRFRAVKLGLLVIGAMGCVLRRKRG